MKDTLIWCPTICDLGDIGGIEQSQNIYNQIYHTICGIEDVCDIAQVFDQ